MGRKRPTNKLTIQKVWVENDPGSTKRGSNIEVRRRLRPADKCLLKKPVMQLKTFGEKSFYYAAPEVWNKLPFELRSCSNLYIFKKKLKTHFFKIAFS